MFNTLRYNKTILVKYVIFQNYYIFKKLTNNIIYNNICFDQIK